MCGPTEFRRMLERCVSGMVGGQVFEVLSPRAYGHCLKLLRQVTGILGIEYLGD